MQTVTLSRIHHIIKNFNDENSRISQRFYSLKLSFNFIIYTNTTQKDFEEFLSRLRSRKEECLKMQATLEINSQYMTYLKNLAAEANSKAGIDKLMNMNAQISREIRYLKDFLAPFDSIENQDIEIIKDVDFYKTTFTEQTRFYTLPVNLFSDQEVTGYQEKLNDLILRQQEINDEIASKNQSIKIRIQKFETFRAALKK